MRPVEIPQSKILDNFVDIGTVVLRQVSFDRIAQKHVDIPQVPIVRTVLKPVEIPQLKFLDMPVVVQRPMTMVLTVRAPLEIHLQILDMVFVIPVVVQQQVPRIPWRLHSCCSWIGMLTCLLIVRRQVPMVLKVQKTVEVPHS